MLKSGFLEIDFEIKTSAKKSRRFDLSEVIFKWVKFSKLAYSHKYVKNKL